MDEIRKIRLEVAPFVFLATILIGAVCSPSNLLRTLWENDGKTWPGALGLVLGAGAGTIAFGFIIQAITLGVLRLAFWVIRRVTCKPISYEAPISDPVQFVRRTWPLMRLSADIETDLPKSLRDAINGTSTQGPVDRQDIRSWTRCLFNAAVSFDHEVLRSEAEGIHLWIVRAWNGFNASASSCVAVILAGLVGYAINIEWGQGLWTGMALAICIFAVTACICWTKVMGMLEFQAKRSWAGASHRAKDEVKTVPGNLDEVTKKLVACFHPQMVLVFGSHARGTSHRYSDFDLLVVSPLNGLTRRQLMVDMDRLLAGLGIPGDIVVLTPGEFARDREIHGTVARSAWLDGKVLYGGAP